MTAKYQDVFSGFFLLIVSGIMFYTAYSFQALTTTRVGPAFMPQIIAIIMAAFSIVIVVNGFIRNRAGKDESIASEPKEEKEEELIITEKKSYKPVFVTLGLMIAYIALIPYVGFLLMTAVYMFVQMLVLSHITNRRIWLFLIISVVTSATIYYLFRNVFYVMLPTGIIG